jgi:poly-gamma-glutamate capsule biosynthesis protein CapA/YwtB (metallophosphatase superfamily)
MERQEPEVPETISLFLCGDVMTGRGIDQVLPHPANPALQEAYVKSARGYVEIAQAANGPFSIPVDFAYVWGDALAELERLAPDARIVNLETAVTRSDAYWRGKEIHYRMHPANAPCLSAAKIDCCVLANNHVLDWERVGLEETLATLKSYGIGTAGAGANRAQAEAPAVVDLGSRGRVVVFGFGTESSGIPRAWAATETGAGVNLLHDLSGDEARRIGALVRSVKRARDIVVASIHWGENWGYEIPREQRQFAHALIDAAGVDVVHGHSSHHVKGIEVYRGKLILYGCGDFLTDYEGITGYETYRGDLGLMYFPALDAHTGRLARLTMTPTQVRRFRVNRAALEDAQWLATLIAREGAEFRSRAAIDARGRLALRWDPIAA